MRMMDAMHDRIMDVWRKRVPDPGALAVWRMGTDAAAAFHRELVADHDVPLDPASEVRTFMGIPVVVEPDREGWDLSAPVVAKKGR